jgi:hypothetical protein
VQCGRGVGPSQVGRGYECENQTANGQKKKNAENRAIADLRLAEKMVFIYPSRVAARARSSRM